MEEGRDMTAEILRNVLVPYDFSTGADRALAWVARLQSRLPETGVRVLHVLTLPATVVAVPMPVVGPAEDDLRAIESDLASAARRHGLRIDGAFELVVSPAPGPCIVQKAEELGSDLIVMGTHGRGGVARAVLGSVADWVVRKAPCPVVVIRAA
jgi:universal stress protein A